MALKSKLLVIVYILFLQEVADDADIEVIFVSSDRSTEDMQNYMKESHGAWLATEHASELVRFLYCYDFISLYLSSPCSHIDVTVWLMDRTSSLPSLSSV